jgi:hypothetical protein
VVEEGGILFVARNTLTSERSGCHGWKLAPVLFRHGQFISLHHCCLRWFHKAEKWTFSCMGVGVTRSTEPPFKMESLKNSHMRRDVRTCNEMRLLHFYNYAGCIKYNLY